MMAQLRAWWAGRTDRERTLIQWASVFVLVILLPLWAFASASAYRADAAAKLAGAREIRANVAQLAEAGATQAAGELAGSDGTLRGLVLAAAQAEGLSVARVEPSGAEGVRVAFAPAGSISLYRWMNTVSRQGAYVRQTALTRSGDADLVVGEFVVASSP